MSRCKVGHTQEVEVASLILLVVMRTFRVSGAGGYSVAANKDVNGSNGQAEVLLVAACCCFGCVATMLLFSPE